VQKVEVHAAHKLRVILGERVERAVRERDDSASVRGSSTSISRATPAHQSPVTSHWAGPQGKARLVAMEAILAAIQPYEIHGTPYFRIAYALKDDPDRVAEGRIAAESIYKGAQPGDRVDIRMLLGVIDDVKKLAEG